MPYEEFQRRWRVEETTDPDCAVNDLVTIQVLITCEGKHPYGTGRYVQASNTIESVSSANTYKIRIVDGEPRKIIFETEGALAGSWTAVDTGSWPGDD